MTPGALLCREGRIAFWSFSEPPIGTGSGPGYEHRDVLAALEDGFVLDVPHDPRRVLDTASRCDAIVLNETRVREQEAAKIRAVSDRCYGGAVVVVPPDPQTLCMLAPIRLHDVVLRSDVSTRLVTAVRTAGLCGWCAGIEEAVGEAGFPPVLAGSIRRLVGAVSTGPDALRSLTVVASQVGCSSRYLRKVSRSSGVDLAKLLRRCVVLVALRIRLRERTWERVAWRLGYSSESGLSEAFVRALSRRPSQVDPVKELRSLMRTVQADLLRSAQRFRSCEETSSA